MQKVRKEVLLHGGRKVRYQSHAVLGTAYLLLLLLLFLENFFLIPRKKWTYTVLLAGQRVNEISGVQSWSTKLVEINSVCPRS